MQELEECRLKVSHILQSSLMSDGSRRFATPPQQIAVYNKRIQPVKGEETETSPPWVFTDKDYVVGDEVTPCSQCTQFCTHAPCYIQILYVPLQGLYIPNLRQQSNRSVPEVHWLVHR